MINSISLRSIRAETGIRKIYQRYYLVLLFAWIPVSSCNTNNSMPSCGSNGTCIPTDGFFDRLSEYHIYENNLSDLEPADGLLPYGLNTPLFSDYALKLRFVYLPENSTVSYNKEGVLDFPAGSMLVKNFFYENDRRDPSAGRKLIETRLLIRQSNRWMAATYIWNERQTDAFLQETGDSKEVEWIDRRGRLRKVSYLIPTKNDCKACHSSVDKIAPIGPKVGNLNNVFQYNEGAENQLVRWVQEGILQDSPELMSIPKDPVWDNPKTGTIEERVRTYLDVNCAHCHNQTGSANNSGLFLSFSEEDPFRYGICKTPVAAGPGSGGRNYDIVPGHPDKSILVYRMESVEPASRMPELGRTLVHDEAVELIREWIEKMELFPCK